MGDDVELPPDIGSSPTTTEDLELPDDVPSTTDDLELPDDVGSMSSIELPGESAGCRCRKKCALKIPPEVIEGMRLAQSSKIGVERSIALFEALKKALIDSPGKLHEKGSYAIGDVEVCRSLWEYSFSTSRNTINKMKKLLQNGHITYPTWQTRATPSNGPSGLQFSKADIWFLELYQSISEPDPAATSESCFNPEPKDPLALLDNPLHPLTRIGLTIKSDGKHYGRLRNLNHQHFEDLFNLHETQMGMAAVSRSTLRKAWKGRWKRLMPFRNIGQGKRCAECCELDEERAQACSHEEKQVASEKKKVHIDGVTMDHDVTTRTNLLSALSSFKPSVDGLNQVINIRLDGMDQAKFRCPRNLGSNATFDGLWKPTLHLVGCVVPNYMEAYFLMDSDQKKDANMNCTVISRMLDLINDKYFACGSFAMPQTLIVGFDNTCREGKNQIGAKYLSYLTATEKFESTGAQMLTKGHSHNEQDQRFLSRKIEFPTFQQKENWKFGKWKLQFLF